MRAPAYPWLESHLAVPDGNVFLSLAVPGGKVFLSLAVPDGKVFLSRSTLFAWVVKHLRPPPRCGAIVC